MVTVYLWPNGYPFSMRRDVFQAIADPVRRQILHLLAVRPLNLSGVAQHFAVSRPAISRHIKILFECGLVTVRQQGRERVCEARLDRLSEVAEWAGQYQQFWKKKINAPANYLKEIETGNKPKRRKAGVKYRLAAKNKRPGKRK